MLTKELETTVEKVVKECKKDESPLDAALWAINQIAIQIGNSHIEMVGLLEESKLTLRQLSLNTLEEEDQNEKA